MNGRTLNLDRLAAQRAQSIVARTKAGSEGAKEVDNTVTKGLGVLQENGLYACALFLLSRPDTERGRATVVLDELLNLLTGLGYEGWDKPNPAQSEAVLSFISDTVTTDLSRLLLAKEVSEQMLIYARYGAKAWAGEEGNGGQA